jgi:F-type H+-transporting ATPase subunit delta
MSIAVANRYARALAEVVYASGSGLAPEQILSEVGALSSAVVGSAELTQVLRSPAVTLNAKRNVLGKMCDVLGSSKTVRNLAFVVADHNRADILPVIRQAFENVVNERRGVAQADVTLAAETSAEQKQKLEAALSQLTGKLISATYSIDPALIGGATARIGSTVYDGSVRGQLAAIKQKLTRG